MTEIKHSITEDFKTNTRTKNNNNIPNNSNVDFVFDPVPEAPTFKPNDQEFKDPLAYINQIRPIAEQFGICKIIPPKTWKPKFCIDMNNFKFTPRVQRLNELEANTRIKINFLEKLSKFWELQGNKFKIPIVERKPVDLYKLHKQVEIMGGFEIVVKNKLMSHVSKLMGYKDSSTSRVLKIHYENILYPFLLFEAGITIPDGVTASKNDTLDDIDYDTTSPVKKVKENNVKEIESIKCLVCGRGDDEAFMLLCDGCDDSYHTFCLLPPLKEIPKGDWRCPVCVSQICKKPTESYGFEQSKRTYTLNEFGEMGNKFKSNYFKKPHQTVGLDECEKEFWRILSSPNESVSVEYGADLHTLEVGSGFPTKSYKGKLTPTEQDYITSPWNLNNISCLEKSVLSQMNVEISGMKVPWAYVGMCFSCFCWHVEDHWSYSINYLHFGDVKTWYGVSGAAAPKFEQVMKMNAAELFEKSPDLLHHLVTIMNPNILRKNNVPIFKVNQKVGEFVVTFPRAYHAGFNQGFNFAEAVNFCPADWMPLGRAAIESYKLVKRHTVFSHDELACKIATNKDLIDINTAFTVQRELKIIYENEKKDREYLIEKGVKNSRKLIFELVPDDDRTCHYCKTTCFVSALRCSCKPDRLVCLSHFDHLCESTTGSSSQNKYHKLTLLYRYSMKELFDILSKLSERTFEYSKWLFKVERILNLNKIKNENANNDSDIEEIDMYDEEDDDDANDMNESNKKPSINKLFKLLEEARLKKYPRYDNLNKSKMFSNNKMLQSHNKINEHLYNELEKEYNKAVKCAKACKDFINLYKNHNFENNNMETDENNGQDDVIFVKKARKLFKPKPSLDELKQLVNDMDNLICNIEEKDLFLSLFNEALDYELKIENLINEWNLTSPNQIKRILNYLDSIDIEFPFLLVEQLKLMYRQSVWLDKVNTAIQNPKELTITMLRDFIDKSIDDNLLMNLSERDVSRKVIQKTIVDLQELLSIAQTWDQKVKLQIESKSLFDLNVLEATLSEAKHIPAKLENVEKLDLIVREASKLILNADKLLKEVKCPYLSDLESMLKLAKHLPVKMNQIQAIEIRANLANDWIKKLITLFKRPDNDISILEILTPRTDLNNIVNKFHTHHHHNHNHHTQLISQTLQTANNITSPPSNNNNNLQTQQSPTKSGQAVQPTKRMRAKSTLISASLNMLSQQANQNNNNNNNQNIEVTHHHNHPIVMIDNVYNFYNENKNMIGLSEKYKAAQIREIDLMKQIRKLNNERLAKFIASLTAENKTESSNQNEVKSSTESSENNKAEHQSSTSLLSTNQKQNKQTHINLKCCSCHKSVMSSIYSNNIQQCKLCLGIYHNSCKIDSNSLICSHCHRSKRPNFNLVIEMLISYERLEIGSLEGNALQMFINHCLNWQERFQNLFNNSNEMKQLLAMMKNKNSISNSDLIQNYESLSSLKKIELENIYIESMLLEANMDEKVILNDLFKIINNNGSSDSKYENEFDKLKAKLINSNILLNLSSSDTNWNENNEINGGGVGKKEKKIKLLKENNKLNSGNSKNEAKLLKKLKKMNDTNSKLMNKIKKSESGTPLKNTRKREIEIEDEEFCAAAKCSGPTGDNIKWVQCDGSCQRWFHMICVGISKIKKKEKYLCNACDDGKESTSQQDWTEQPPLDTDQIEDETNSNTNANSNKHISEQLNSSPSRINRSSKKLKNENEHEINETENVNNNNNNNSNSENNLNELNESTQR